MGKQSKMKIPIKRFQEAQEEEKEYWKQMKTKISSNEYRVSKSRAAADIFNELRATTNDGCLKKVLEIGGGGDPFVEYHKGDLGVAIDPLGAFYKATLLPSKLKSVEYLCGIGEYLPFESSSFDGVLMYNCIDHGVDPFRILDESKRVLRTGGAIHLLLNTYSIQFKLYKELSERITPERRDSKHPHYLRFKVISKYLDGLGFIEIKSCHGEPPYTPIFNKSSVSIKSSLRILLHGHRALRAFYRLEDKTR